MTERKKYLYKVFGLIVSSEIEFPELLQNTGEPDVWIRITTLASRYMKKSASESFWLLSSGKFFLNIGYIGKYLVSNGNVIEVEPVVDCHQPNVKIFILGTCMGALLHQRGVLPVHASGIATKQGCVMFAGVSGVGKSTLATAFNKRGYSIVADDICAISLNENGKAIVSPAYPQVKIKTDTANILGVSTRGLTSAGADSKKFRVSVRANFQENEIPIHKIYFIEESKLSKTMLREIHGKEKLFSLIISTYRKEIIDGLGKTKEHFQVCKLVERQLTAVSLLHKADLQYFNSLVDSIESDLV